MRKITIDTGAGVTGKGSNVFAILELAASIDADAVCLIDGDLRSIEPHWVSALIDASLRTAAATLVTPEYARSRYEANTTNHVVVPYLRAAARGTGGERGRGPIAPCRRLAPSGRQFAGARTRARLILRICQSPAHTGDAPWRSGV